MLPFFIANLHVIRGDPSQLGVFLRSIDLYLSSSKKKSIAAVPSRSTTVLRSEYHSTPADYWCNIRRSTAVIIVKVLVYAKYVY